MDEPPGVTRRFLLKLLPVSGVCFAAAPIPETLDVRLAGDQLKVAAPQFHFVTGKPLERLHNGTPVPFAIQLSLTTDRAAGPLLRDIQRFVLSYDLWEERFAVTKLGNKPRSGSHLTAPAAEAWCVQEMGLLTLGLRESAPFWLRLEVRAEDPEKASSDTNDPLTLARLIDLFSRRGRGEDRRMEVEAGPFRLADLRRPHGALRAKRRFEV